MEEKKEYKTDAVEGVKILGGQDAQELRKEGIKIVGGKQLSDIKVHDSRPEKKS
jgi:hypothetical protein